jgi:Tol biopolymer transport system component
MSRYLRGKSVGLRLIGVAGCAGSLALTCDSGALQQVGDNTNRIVYVSDRDGNTEIYTINIDGLDQKRLTNNPADDRQPQWDRLKTRIVFTSTRKGGIKIFSMYGDGTNVKQLTAIPLKYDSSPTWSPNGQRIAFSSNRDGNWEIYVMNADGSGQTRLTNNSDTEDGPTWSPQGDRIAFHSNRSGRYQIHVMNADGSNQTQITTLQGSNTAPTWSANDTIAFLHDGQDVSGYYTIDPNGTGLEPGGGYGGIPDWDATGENLVFDASSYSGGTDIFRVNIYNGDGEMVQITDFGANFHNIEPNW